MKLSALTVRSVRRTAALLLALAVVLTVLSGCALTDFVFGPHGETTVIETQPTPPVSTEAPDLTEPPESTGTPEATTAPDTDVPDTSAGTTEETTAPVVLYTDPLTGLPFEKDYSTVRPVAIAIDNLSVATPQSGISFGDIVVECMVEGGISRLLLITNKYDGNTVYGPVRSVRDYMVSLSQAFGTLLVGAGYSPTGYTAIQDNHVDYLDGVHLTYALDGFFRDPDRTKNTGVEHALMITGNGIKGLASRYNYSIVKKTSPVFRFAETPVVLSGGDAQHTVLTYSSYQQIQLLYSKSKNTYYRYQYGTKAHLDDQSGAQLNFENVFILFAPQALIPGDDAGRLSVGVTGKGEGYYLTGGKYIPITWSRDNDTSAFSFADASGKKFSVTPGKTMITVMDDRLKGTSSVILNYTVDSASVNLVPVDEQPS